MSLRFWKCPLIFRGDRTNVPSFLNPWQNTEYLKKKKKRRTRSVFFVYFDWFVLLTIVIIYSFVRSFQCMKNWTKCYSGKFFDRAEDSVYEIGEYKRDRYVNIPQYTRRHPETPRKGKYELIPDKGKPFDKKPFPVKLQAGKRYKWCSCGHSKTQVRWFSN